MFVFCFLKTVFVSEFSVFFCVFFCVFYIFHNKKKGTKRVLPVLLFFKELEIVLKNMNQTNPKGLMSVFENFSR